MCDRTEEREMKKVVKFGGSSLASAEQFKKVGEIIRADKERRFTVVLPIWLENPLQLFSPFFNSSIGVPELSPIVGCEYRHLY